MPSVVSIKGNWGIGKTFTWNECINELKNSASSMQDKPYSYVSLFGIDSLQDLKFQIFQQVISMKEIGNEVQVHSFTQKWSNAVKKFGRKNVGIFANLYNSGKLAVPIQSIAFQMVSRYLICIDDIERRGGNLSISDVMGLVSFLKEERNCQVILIYNNGALSECEQKEYRRYRDKVIDIELEFKPISAESCDIAFTKGYKLADELSYYCTMLGVDNIRILRRIERFSDQITPLLKEYEPDVLREVLRSFCLLAWSCYGASETSPDYQYVKAKRLMSTFTKENKELSSQEKLWNSYLQDYGYYYTEELDLEICNLLENGYIEEDGFVEIIRKKYEEIRATKGHESFKSMWRKFYEGFENNEEEMVSRIVEGIRNIVKYVSVPNLDQTVDILRELGRNVEAGELINFYVEKRKNDLEPIDLEKYSSFHKIHNEEIISSFAEIEGSFANESDIVDVVMKIAEIDGWSPEDLDLLVIAEEEEYLRMFKKIRGEDQAKCINACLQFGRLANATDQHKKIYELASSALRTIGKECNINRMRVRRYGIDV